MSSLFCGSVWKSAALTRCVFVKYIWDFTKYVNICHYWFKSDKTSGHFTWRPTHIYETPPPPAIQVCNLDMCEIEPKKVDRLHISVEHIRYLYFSEMSIIRTKFVRYAVKNMVSSSSNMASSFSFSLFHRAFQFTIYNGPTNALVCIKTLI
jgi:hypothetical protein